MSKKAVYPFEDVREFFIRRSFLVNGGNGSKLTAEEYAGLRERSLLLAKSRASYLRAYIAGWVDGRPDRC